MDFWFQQVGVEIRTLDSAEIQFQNILLTNDLYVTTPLAANRQK